ncbi:hypothetical protein KP509_38G010700 [Ceratopteris richardii]|uniref:TF-B3 domain-containing protein n=2 Tax=Ceratopteris richardii TaxID=49495 RepID=A0A8T2Q2J2_CERRI|nr:hypothetical protein KP509_38G010700 [Ceratopteris richardii]
MSAENYEQPPFSACPSCTHQCRQILGHGFSPYFYTPSFYSILPAPPSSSSLTLPIPPDFLCGKNIRIDRTSTFDEPLYSKMHLQGPTGEKWPVVMEGTSLRNLAFTTGWGNFIQDHSIVAGDLVIFKLTSKGCFSVSIYESNGCEKVLPSAAKDAGSRPVQNGNGSRKRLACDAGLTSECTDGDFKRRKDDIGNRSPPSVIVIDDDEEDECEECTPKPSSGSPYQISSADDVTLVQNGIACLDGATKFSDSEERKGVVELKMNHNNRTVGMDMDSPADSEDVCMILTEHSLACTLDMEGNENSQQVGAQMIPTANGADEGAPAIRMETQVITYKDDRGGNVEEPKCQPNMSHDIKQKPSSDDEDLHQDSSDGDMPSDSDSGNDDPDVPPYCAGEATQGHIAKATKDMEYITASFISKRRPVSAEERQRVFQAAKQFKSNRPHFLKLMKESHVYRGFWLAISSNFASKYLSVENQEATLLDSSGRAWSAKWLGKRCGLSGGWRKFSLDHGLEEGDICVFELIKSKDLVMKVHIFRVIELRNSVPGRDHYLYKPSTRSVSESCISVKKMRGALTDRTYSKSPRFGHQKNQWQSKEKNSEGKLNDTAINCSRGDTLVLNTTKRSRYILDDNGKESRDDVLQRERKDPVVCKPAELPYSLKTPQKTQEPVPGNLRRKKNVDVNSAVGSNKESRKLYYTVERLFNRRKGLVEEEFLVELDIKEETVGCISSQVTRDRNLWWVPLSHFTSDKTSCYL